MKTATYTVPSPLPRARNSALYYYRPKAQLPPLSSFPWQGTIKEELLSPLCRAVIQVSVLYMARIGEILSLKVKNVVHPDRVISYGSKGSHGYMMYLPGLSSQIEEWLYRKQDTSIFPLTYMQAYRGCVKAGILLNDGQGGNSMKCHAHRYLFARHEQNQVGSLGVKIGLHHKSIKSQQAYVKAKIPRCKVTVSQEELPLSMPKHTSTSYLTIRR